MQSNEYANQAHINNWNKLDWQVWFNENRRALHAIGIDTQIRDMISYLSQPINDDRSSDVDGVVPNTNSDVDK